MVGCVGSDNGLDDNCKDSSHFQLYTVNNKLLELVNWFWENKHSLNINRVRSGNFRTEKNVEKFRNGNVPAFPKIFDLVG